MRRQLDLRFKAPIIRSFLFTGTLALLTFSSPSALLASETDSVSSQAQTSAVTNVPEARSGKSIKTLFSDVSQYIGIRYRFGGQTPSGFDCSGFVRYMFGKVFDMQLPRTSREMSSIGTRVPFCDLKPGDLVFFRNKRNQINHVGIFVGDGTFVHSSLSRGITSDRLHEKYFETRFAAAVRILDLPADKQPTDVEQLVKELIDTGKS
jgi:cell wall-associated NlpC family hydrolase